MTNKIKESIKILEEKGYRVTAPNAISRDGLLDVPELGIEVEIEVTHKNMSYDKIMALEESKDKIKDGWRLMYLIRPGDYVNEVVFLANNKKYSETLKMDGSSTKDDFFIEQPLELNKKNGFVARFCMNSGYAVLNCGYDSGNSGSSLGVRWVRKKIFKKIK